MIDLAEQLGTRVELGGHHVPFAVVGFDRDLRIVAWSGRAAQMLGLAPADALGRSIDELLPVVAGTASWRDLLVDSDDAPPMCLTHGDGWVWEWTPAPLCGADGRATGVVCYGRDVSARAAEQRQAELEHVMTRIIVDNLPVIAAAYAPDGEYLVFEGKGLEALGLQPGQMVGQNPLDLYADNLEGIDFIRRGLAGEALPPRLLYEYGRYLASWHIPVPPGNRAALVSISLDVTDAKLRERELLEKIDVIERQQRVIRELSTPIIEVWDGVLALPIIGLVDSMRTSQIMDSLLQSVGRQRARFAILDLTGVDVVDTATANHLIAMIRALRLLGAEGILTGIHPGIAQTIVTLGVDLHDITVQATLRQALVYCIARGRAAK